MPVAAHAPGVVLRVHDVAVHARRAIGGEVGEALRVHEGEGADSDGIPSRPAKRTARLVLFMAPSLTPYRHQRTMTGPQAVSKMLPRAYGTV